MGMREIEIAQGIILVIHEMEDVCDSVTCRTLTGAWIWDSAMVLSQWMSDQAPSEYDFKGKTVVEFGAGTGLPGLTAAKLGANRVILTVIQQLIPVLQKNAEANELGDRVTVCQSVWGSELPVQLRELEHVDLVLLSDVFFDVMEMSALAKTLKEVCRNGTTVWAATEVRPWTTDSLKELASEGFEIVELSSTGGDVLSSEDWSSGISETYTVFQLIPPDDDGKNLEAWSPIVPHGIPCQFPKQIEEEK